MWEFLKGKKTYALCIAAIISALYQLHTGAIDVNTAWDMIMGVLAAASMRHAIGAPKQQ